MLYCIWPLTYRAGKYVMGTAVEKKTLTYSRVVKLHLAPRGITLKYSTSQTIEAGAVKQICEQALNEGRLP